MNAWLPRILLPALLLTLAAGMADAQSQKGQKKVYRWVDKNGQVHYGDSVPAEYADQDRDVLNRQGVTASLSPALPASTTPRPPRSASN
jgi:hypothetical protein